MNIIKKGVRYTAINIKKRLYKGHAPDFIIAGAQKSGTSSLYHYLSLHPNLLASTPKEVRYFDRDDNFQKGKEWYHRSFINLNSYKKNYLCFEATPEYLYRSFAAKRMYQEYPDLKIIIILREPVKRAYSAWNMNRDFKEGNIPRVLLLKNGYIHDRQHNLFKELYAGDHFPSFEEAIDSELLKIENNSELEEPAFLRRGIYLPQIKRYHDLFGHENVLILGFKDLLQNKEKTLNKVLKFLGLEESDWSFLKDEIKNARNYTEKMSAEMEEKLISFYKPHNKELFNYLGTNINW